MTYTLPGFSTFKRDAVEVTTGVTVTINAEMKIGGLQETITVSGETPVVDVQNSTRNQRVLERLRLLAGDGIRHSGQRHPEQRLRARHDLLHVARRP